MLPGKINLLDFDQQALRIFFESKGEKPFRAIQLVRWIHQQGISDFEQMSNLSKVLRADLQKTAEIKIPELVWEQVSVDGTRKWLLKLEDTKDKLMSPVGNRIEMVFIPEDGRGTLCISSQIGCTLDCSFCSTARQGFNRNLSTAEIIGQLWLARKLLVEGGVSQGVSNVVLMGMGEPLHNFKNVVTAINLMLDDNAYGLSKRRVTLSTAGVVPMIDRLKAVSEVSLAVSLHAPNNDLRDQLVPVNKKYPIEELIPACERYIEGSHKRLITFEYIMLDGINDQLVHARELAALIRGIPCKVNLIPFNPFPQAGYRRSPADVIDRFREVIQHSGIVTVTRKTRGDDIDAACGQLVGKVKDLSQRHLRFQSPRYGAVSI